MSAASVSDLAAFTGFAARVRGGVDTELASFVARRVVAARAHGGEVQIVVDALAALATRGGKRVRPVLLGAAYEACGGEGAEKVVLAGLALELLQAYLLIHDDWMDDDDVRRGGPSVHATLRVAFGSTRMGDSAAILAGDHASALAQEVLLSVPAPAGRVLEAAQLFARIQEDVVYGQLLDLRAGSALDSGDTGLEHVEAMHDLKTGSYTVRGPIALGAILAGASGEQRRALADYARPLGIAFQLRDDLLGTFGDAKTTGKSVGNDLRQGKRTALVAELATDAEAARLLPRVLGVEDAPDAEISALLVRMVASGAKLRVEKRLDALLAEARAALVDAPIEASARAILLGSVLALGDRES